MPQNPASYDAALWDKGRMQVRFIGNSLDADSQIREWGLDRDLLKEVVFFAQSYHNECTLNDPPGFELVIAYARAARRLRELCVPRGWAADTSQNQTAIRHEELRLRVYPCNFCSNTASPHRSPVNLTVKGPAARRDTNCNAQLSLFDCPEILYDPVISEHERYQTLLLGMNFEGENAKAELSVPVKFMQGRFTGLAVRVPILDGTEVGPTTRTDIDRDDAFKEIDISISRKL